jgi:5-(carboxyamino)imidazole ribonucleotide mutase
LIDDLTIDKSVGNGGLMVPEVMIILGSESDLEIAKKAVGILEGFQISYTLKVASAHRTHDLVRNLVVEGTKRGVKVFIGMAGLAAHLPGVMASYTHRPVIGVPVDVELSGIDSLLASIQTPYPASVATVGINRGDNAGILAAEILSVGDEEIKSGLHDLRKSFHTKVNGGEKEVLSQIDGKHFKDFQVDEPIVFSNVDETNFKEEGCNDDLIKTPDVTVILDGYSNIKIGENLIEILNRLGVSYDFKVISSIANPTEFERYMETVKDVKLFVGVGGSSAHVTGSIVALSEKPVIGVPCSNQLNGLDALVSMVNMPPGVPVGVVGMDSGENGALLVGKILGLLDKRIEINLKGEIADGRLFK